MTAGSELRKTLGRGDILALLAVQEIIRLRMAKTGDAKKPVPRRAYVLRSLKHPDEVKTLRRIYGPAFVLYGVSSPRDGRIATLAKEIAESHHEFDSSKYRKFAEEIVSTDEAEHDNPLGQHVRRAFPEADFFLDARDPEQLTRSIRRSIELLFGRNVITPTRDEFCMFHAQAAALRSASLQRQVGAVIASLDGTVIAVGTNEVPKPGGGLYWADDTPDRRDFRRGYEISDVLRRRVFSDVLARLKSAGWLSSELSNLAVDELVRRALEKSEGGLKEARVFEIIEFGRCVHAEMAAIVDAARRGVAVEGALLYTTTYPCHDCARHIIASGINRVVFIEPYPKSLVSELFDDLIRLEGGLAGSEVVFEPFVGVAPRRYMDLFSMTATRRNSVTGTVVHWDGKISLPKLGDFSGHWLASAFFEINRLEEVKPALRELIPVPTDDKLNN